jgi:hypothetical protein
MISRIKRSSQTETRAFFDIEVDLPIACHPERSEGPHIRSVRYSGLNCVI